MSNIATLFHSGRNSCVATIWCDGHGDAFLVDGQTEIMNDLVHGCLVRFTDDDSGDSHASHIAERSALADNPRSRIKHPLRFHAKP